MKKETESDKKGLRLRKINQFAKGANLESLAKSRAIRQDFIARYKGVPTSILIHDRRQKAIDLIRDGDGRSYSDASMMLGGTEEERKQHRKNRDVRKGRSYSNQSVRFNDPLLNKTTLPELKERRARTKGRAYMSDMGGHIAKLVHHAKSEEEVKKGMDGIWKDTSARKGRAYKKSGKEFKDHDLDTKTNLYLQERGARKGALSSFSQNIGRLLVDFYCPHGGAVYDPFCVTGDTLISTPEGDFPIMELVGEEPFVFCSDGKGLHLRKAYNIRKTREWAKVVRVRFTKNKHIDVTPDHLFMTTSGEWVKAKDLKNKQSLMPFYRMVSHGRWVVQIGQGKYRRQSRFIYEEIHKCKIDPKINDTHHKDQNKLNDSPGNLELKTKGEHGRTHHPKGVAPYKATEESRKNLSAATTGKKNPFYGKRHSEISKALVGASSIGRNKGRVHSNETKKKISSTRKDRSYVAKVQELLVDGTLSYQAIANRVGVHKNTVDNIANNRFLYNHQVVSVEHLPNRADVYNMEVEEFENFAANGVIVHNCGHNSRMQLCYELGRSYTGVDVSKEFMEANDSLLKILLGKGKKALIKNDAKIRLCTKSSHSVPEIESNSHDFTITSPPYWNLEYYGDEPEQLGNCPTYDSFIAHLQGHAVENFRILKKGAYCVWCINDFRLNGVFYPFHMDTYKVLEMAGFTPYTIYIIDLGVPITQAFVQTILQTKMLPKKHEYVLVFKK